MLHVGAMVGGPMCSHFSSVFSNDHYSTNRLGERG